MGWVVNATSLPLYPRKRTGTHGTGSYMGPRAGLDGCGGKGECGNKRVGECVYMLV
jgi:hypothetical protein